MPRNVPPRSIVPALAALLACLGLPTFSGAVGPNPVEDLRKAVEHAEPIPVLQQHADRLKSLPEFLEAVQIRFLVTTIDKGYRDFLDDQLRGAVRKMVKKVVQEGDEISKVALAVRLGEMEIIAVPFGSPESLDHYRRFMLELSAELQALIVSKKSTPRVRQHAAQSLGRVLVEPAEAVAVLKGMLGPDHTLAENRAAVTALASLVKNYEALHRKTATGSEVIRTEDLLAMAEGVGAGIRAGLGREDLTVRRAALNTLIGAGLILDSDALLRVPPERLDAEFVLNAEKGVKPALASLNQVLQDPAFLKTLSDPDPVQRLLSLKGVEHLATIRLRLNLRREQVGQPHLSPAEDVLLPGLKLAVQRLAGHLGSPDPALRLSAAEFLERVADLAGPATKELSERLKDQSTFVRWAAVRALGQIAYLELQPLGKAAEAALANEPLQRAVLALGSAACERDLEVRVTVAETITMLAYTAYEAKAPAARDKAMDILRLTVPELAQAVQAGDREARVALMKAISSTGVTAEQAPQVTQVLIGVLQHEDPKVRQAAAETLGNIGPAAANASSALQKALNDNDEFVRRAASDALLKIKL